MAKGTPYGILNFSRLIDQDYYYADKTQVEIGEGLSFHLYVSIAEAN